MLFESHRVLQKQIEDTSLENLRLREEIQVLKMTSGGSFLDAFWHVSHVLFIILAQELQELIANETSRFNELSNFISQNRIPECTTLSDAIERNGARDLDYLAMLQEIRRAPPVVSQQKVQLGTLLLKVVIKIMPVHVTDA